MGLFDTIIIEDNIELPEFPGDPGEMGWQSKSVDPNPRLRKFKIENGKLHERHVEREENGNQGDGFPKFHVTDDYWEERDYHGEFTFYSSVPETLFSGEDIDAEWFEYKVKFTDGELQDIERVEHGHMR